MKVLDNRTAYLSGPIQYQKETDWREPVKEVLTKEFNIHVFDPYQDPSQSKTNFLNALRDGGRWDELRETTREFVRADLSIVDHSDFLIAYLPDDVKTVGTCHEIINSNNSKKPTLLVCPESKRKIPFWYFGIIHHQFMFGSWEELYSYLREVNDFKHVKNDRWFFVYHYFLKEKQVGVSLMFNPAVIISLFIAWTLMLILTIETRSATFEIMMPLIMAVLVVYLFVCSIVAIFKKE